MACLLKPREMYTFANDGWVRLPIPGPISAQIPQIKANIGQIQ